MDSEARHPDIPGRLRVVDLRIGSERRQLHFGGGFACVLADTDARTAAARWIAATIVGPAPSVSHGPPDAEGEEPVWHLQAPLLPLRVPAVLDRGLLHTIWRSDCACRLEAIAASHGSLQMERSRISGALEQTRVQSPLSAAAASTLPRSRAADDELAAFKAAARRFVRVQSLLREIDAFVPEVPAEALELADAWDEHLAFATGSPPSGEPAADAASPANRAPGATAPEPVDDARRAELERLHYAAIKAETRLFGRGLLPRKRAVARYNEARLREQAALAGAGVGSYTEFLLGLDANESTEDRTQPAHDAEATDLVSEPDATQPAAELLDEHAARAVRTQELLARARSLLGRDPGEDVAGELRAHLADPPALVEIVEVLAEVLREEGLSDVDDVIERARAFVASPPSVHVPQPPTWAMRVSMPEVPLREIEALERELRAKDEQIRELDLESARVAATSDLDLLRLGPDDFVRVLGAMLDAYREGEVLEGHLPLVLDGALDGLAVDARDAAVLALAAVDDIQVIVVTDDDNAARRVEEAGGTIVHWSASAVQRQHSG